MSCFIANLTSFVLDYCVRQKLGGTNMTYGYFRQFPVLPPPVYTRRLGCIGENMMGEWIAARVLELVYTACDMAPFARDMGYYDEPFHWDPERRFRLRCELDALFFRLYGIDRDDAAYIMDTFPIVAKKDNNQYGEYRTKRVILEIYDELTSKGR